MDRTQAFGNVLGPTGLRMFVNQNLAAGVNGTDGDAADALAWQEELMGVIEGAGLVGSAANLKQVWEAIALAVARGTSTTILTLQQSGTLTVPAGKYWARVELVGGGGGGGGSSSSTSGGGGGGSGGYARRIFAVTPGQVIPYVVGQGGTPGVGGGSPVPGAGGTTSFNAMISATGGAGAGFSGSFAFGGNFGQGFGDAATFVSDGGCGGDGLAGSLMYPGNGAASYFGQGGRAGVNGGFNAGAWGSGGGGAYDASGTATGGIGGAGVIVVEM